MYFEALPSLLEVESPCRPAAGKLAAYRGFRNTSQLKKLIGKLKRRRRQTLCEAPGWKGQKSTFCSPIISILVLAFTTFVKLCKFHITNIYLYIKQYTHTHYICKLHGYTCIYLVYLHVKLLGSLLIGEIHRGLSIQPS